MSCPGTEKRANGRQMEQTKEQIMFKNESRKRGQQKNVKTTPEASQNGAEIDGQIVYVSHLAEKVKNTPNCLFSNRKRSSRGVKWDKKQS